MVEVDGSFGEGGGQILRTAVGLSAFLGIPCRVYNIRKGRPNPGLRPQHVAGVKAILKICRGEAEGLWVGSEDLTFRPGKLRGGQFKVDVGTAGAIGLVLQALLVPCLGVPSKVSITVTGGTDVKGAPTVGYLQQVLLPILREMGYRADLSLVRRGYYPKGGGEVVFRAEGGTLRGIKLTHRGEILGIYGVSHASSDLKGRRVAERQREAALKVLREQGYEGEIRVRYEDALSTGSGIDLWAIGQGTILGANALGERGKRAEEVGREAAEALLEELSTGACLDRHLADQLVPFLALASGESEVSISQVTEHLRTNLWVIRHFPGCKALEVEREGTHWVLRARDGKID